MSKHEFLSEEWIAAAQAIRATPVAVSTENAPSKAI